MTTSEPEPKRAKRQCVSANDAIRFVLEDTLTLTGIKDSEPFDPIMTHQLFGDEEEIKGFSSVSITIRLSRTFHALCSMVVDGKAALPASILSEFSEVFQDALCTDPAKFEERRAAEFSLDPSALGLEEVHAQDLPNGMGTLHICGGNLASGSKELKALHARFEPLLCFYVDSASRIDPEDANWSVLFAFVKPASDPSRFFIAGMTTLYSFYGYPVGRRMRVSQVLVLPPHQSRGVGAALLRGSWSWARRQEALDLTFEEPSADLCRLRDGIALAALAGASWACAAAERAAGSGQVSALACPPSLKAQARSELLLSRSLTAHLWPALLLARGKGGAGAEALVRRAVAAGVQASVDAASRDAKGKAVEETESGFVMLKRRGAGGEDKSSGGGEKGKAPAAEEDAGGVALEAGVAAGQAAEAEREIQRRMDDAEALARRLA